MTEGENRQALKFVRMPQLQTFAFGTTRAPIGVAGAKEFMQQIVPPSAIRSVSPIAGIAVIEAGAHVEKLAAEGAKVYDNVKFQHFDELPDHARYWDRQATGVMAPEGLADVLNQIRAPQAWAQSRGAGAMIAVVDSGICATLPEMEGRRHDLDVDSAYRGSHWDDDKGHGSMCAVIAAGCGNGGALSGVAPEAKVISCRTDFWASDISDIYTNLILAKRVGHIGGPLIVNNSWGLYTCQPGNQMPSDHPFMDIILAAIDEGIVVVFAAGNNHHDVCCNYPPQADGPNTIWGPNSHDRVLSVGTINRQESNRDPTTPHVNSSRGPGEWALRHPKPDCVAPTYGQIVWGCGRTYMDWWGTSGAAPQVSGLAALLLSARPNLTPAQVCGIIRASARQLDAPATCVGSGIIDCQRALNEALAMV